MESPWNGKKDHGGLRRRFYGYPCQAPIYLQGKLENVFSGVPRKRKITYSTGVTICVEWKMFGRGKQDRVYISVDRKEHRAKKSANATNQETRQPRETASPQEPSWVCEGFWVVHCVWNNSLRLLKTPHGSSLTSFMSLLKCHLLNEASPDHPILNSHPPHHFLAMYLVWFSSQPLLPEITFTQYYHLPQEWDSVGKHHIALLSLASGTVPGTE